MIGRRRSDTKIMELPEDVQPGDYWKALNSKGEPVVIDNSSNLTGTRWGFYGPLGGYGVLSLHTVREHEDGTISVLPGDGSSNSIGFTNAEGKYWHGYIYNGEWKEA